MAINGNPSPATITTKYWIKEPYAKMEGTSGGITQTTIMRPEGVYIYNSSNGTYVKTSSETPLSQQNFNDFLKQVKENKNYQVIGKETINGKTSTILSYTNTSMGMNVDTKMWIWNEKGLPLKMEMTMTFGSAVSTTTILMDNFSFADIPDSTFNIS